MTYIAEMTKYFRMREYSFTNTLALGPAEIVAPGASPEAI